MFNWLKKKTCQHEFEAKNIQLTGIPELPKPETRGYQEWSDYFGEIYTHDSITKRIKCDCEKCGTTIYESCGLNLMHHGELLFNYDKVV